MIYENVLKINKQLFIETKMFSVLTYITLNEIHIQWRN